MQVIINSVVILFILIFLGFFLGKRQVLRQDAAADFSTLVLQVTMPVTIFLSFVSQEDAGTLGESLWIIPAMLVFHAVAFLIGILAVKIFHPHLRQKGCWIYTIMFSNNGFMGLPLALSIYGGKGLLIMALGNMVSNLLMFSIGVKILTRDVPEADPISFRKMFLTNINLSVVLGILFCLFHIHLPDVVQQLLDYISNISSGLSMLVVGLSLSRISIKEVFSDAKMFILSAIRLLAVPLLTIAVVNLLPISWDPTLKSILILSSALPAAAAQSMITEQYHGDTKSSGQAVFLTTLFSVVTVPVIMMIGL